MLHFRFPDNHFVQLVGLFLQKVLANPYVKEQKRLIPFFIGSAIIQSWTQGFGWNGHRDCKDSSWKGYHKDRDSTDYQIVTRQYTEFRI